MPEVRFGMFFPFHLWIWAWCIHQPSQKLFVIDIDFFLNPKISPLVRRYYTVVSYHTRECWHVFLWWVTIGCCSGCISWCSRCNYLSIAWIGITSRCWNRCLCLATICIFLHWSWNNLRPIIWLWIPFN